MGDRTNAAVVLHVPEGGVRAGVAAALGVESPLPDWLTEDGDAQQVLLQGGTITVEDGDANYGRIHGWDAGEWSRHLGGIDVDASWGHGGDYGPGAEYVRAGAQHDRAELDGETMVSESWLQQKLESGATLAAVLVDLAVPAVAYTVGPHKAELQI
jgi:hypothetical protein